MVHVHSADGGAHHALAHVESGQELEAVAGELEVFHQGPAQVACPQYHYGVTLADPQDLPDLLPQQVHLISIALLAELTEAEQVLTDLGCGQPHGLPQGAGGDPDHALPLKLQQMPVISRQPAYHRRGNLCISLHRVMLHPPSAPGAPVFLFSLPHPGAVVNF